MVYNTDAFFCKILIVLLFTVVKDQTGSHIVIANNKPELKYFNFSRIPFALLNCLLSSLIWALHDNFYQCKPQSIWPILIPSNLIEKVIISTLFHFELNIINWSFLTFSGKWFALSLFQAFWSFYWHKWNIVSSAKWFELDLFKQNLKSFK